MNSISRAEKHIRNFRGIALFANSNANELITNLVSRNNFNGPRFVVNSIIDNKIVDRFKVDWV